MKGFLARCAPDLNFSRRCVPFQASIAAEKKKKKKIVAGARGPSSGQNSSFQLYFSPDPHLDWELFSDTGSMKMKGPYEKKAETPKYIF